MAKVQGPLFSKKASGKFGKAIIFRCGHFVTKIQKGKSGEASKFQQEQREKFALAAQIWREVLSDEQREGWRLFVERLKHPKGYYRIDVAGIVGLVPIGFRSGFQRCIETGRYNCYHYFVSAFLRFGEGGWAGYPNPPEFSG